MKHTSYFDGQIQTFDNVFSENILEKMVTECWRLDYRYGASDSNSEGEKIPTGLTTMGIDYSETFWYRKLWRFCEDNIPELDDWTLARHHVNLFAPNENARYHTDQDRYKGRTVLFYANLYWDINELGETKFLVSDSQKFKGDIKTSGDGSYPIVLSIAPIPGRVIIFNGAIQHSATALRQEHRFTPTFQFIDHGLIGHPKIKYAGEHND